MILEPAVLLCEFLNRVLLVRVGRGNKQELRPPTMIREEVKDYLSARGGSTHQGLKAEPQFHLFVVVNKNACARDALI